jgi:hypothetical protein
MTRVFLMSEVPSHPQTEVPMKTSTVPSVLYPPQKLLLTAVAVALFISQVAHGAGAGMPWETPLNNPSPRSRVWPRWS